MSTLAAPPTKEAEPGEGYVLPKVPRLKLAHWATGPLRMTSTRELLKPLS